MDNLKLPLIAGAGGSQMYTFPDVEPADEKEDGRRGILGFVGTTGVGKTHLALEKLKSLAKEGIPCLIVDSCTVDNFSEFERANSPQEVAEALWGKQIPEKKIRIVAWTPRDVDEFDMMVRAIQAARSDVGVAILIDEISLWKQSQEMPFLFRTWRHSKTTILVTSQHVSADLGQVLFGCNPRIYIFRTTAPRSLDWLFKWHGLDPDEIRTLPDRFYLVKRF